MKIVVGGSMKNRGIIIQIIKDLNNLGLNAVCPNIGDDNINQDKAETKKEKLKFAWDHYKKIETADAVYLINPDGYMGNSCKIELGYALACKKPIYFSERTDSIDLDCYVKKIIPINNLELFLKE